MYAGVWSIGRPGPGPGQGTEKGGGTLGFLGHWDTETLREAAEVSQTGSWQLRGAVMGGYLSARYHYEVPDYDYEVSRNSVRGLGRL